MEYWKYHKTRRGELEIKKLTINEYLEFSMIYTACLQTLLYIETLKKRRWHNRKEIREMKKNIKDKLNILIDIVVYRKEYIGYLTEKEKKNIDKKRRVIELLTYKEKRVIIEIAKKYNEVEKKEVDGKQKIDENWLQGLIAYFGSEFGYSKSEVMNLYLCEVNLIIMENEKRKIKDLERETKYKLQLLYNVIKAGANISDKESQVKNDKIIYDMLSIVDIDKPKEKVVLAEDNKQTQRQFANLKNMQRRKK